MSCAIHQPSHQDMIFKPHNFKVHLLLGESNSTVGEGKHSKSFSQLTARLQPLRTVNLYITPLSIHSNATHLTSAGVVAFTGQWYYSQYCPVQVHGLKASSLGSSTNFQRLMATLYFSVLLDSPKTLRRTTLIRVTVFVSRFSDSTRSKVSPTFT